MVAQYNFTSYLQETRNIIKIAFYNLLKEYGDYSKFGEYSLDLTKLKSPIRFMYIPCETIIRSGSEILFEHYNEEDEETETTTFFSYGIETLAMFYDNLAMVVNNELKDKRQY